MGKSTYEIRIAGTVPLDLLENFRQIEAVEPAGWHNLACGADGRFRTLGSDRRIAGGRHLTDRDTS